MHLALETLSRRSRRWLAGCLAAAGLLVAAGRLPLATAQQPPYAPTVMRYHAPLPPGGGPFGLAGQPVWAPQMYVPGAYPAAPAAYGMPYGATPYASMPYGATPYGAMPYGAMPYAAAPASVPAQVAPVGHVLPVGHAAARTRASSKAGDSHPTCQTCQTCQHTQPCPICPPTSSGVESSEAPTESPTPLPMIVDGADAPTVREGESALGETRETEPRSTPAGESYAPADSQLSPQPLGSFDSAYSSPSGMSAPSYASQGADAFALGAAGVPGGPGSALPSAVGYIDNAFIATQFRFRYDAMYDAESADRAAYMYNPQAFFFINGALAGGADRVDLQEFRYYFEYALTCRLSVFAEGVHRIVRGFGYPNTPLLNDRVYDAYGFGDVNAGLKFALITNPCWYTTAQLRVYAPSGYEQDGLGNGVTAIEAGLLHFHRITSWMSLEAEIKDWVALEGTFLPPPAADAGRNYGGRLLQAGLGLSVDIWQSVGYDPNYGGAKFSIVNEAVMWTVFDGLKTRAVGVADDATGDTIVNYKIGGRFTLNQGSLYAGFGFPMTDQQWYDGLLRVEFRRAF